MNLHHIPSEIICHLLVDLGLASNPDEGEASWPVYREQFPDRPNNAICVFSVEGVKQGRTQIDGEVQLQRGISITVRSAGKDSGERKARKIHTKFDSEVYRNIVIVDSASYLVEAISNLGDVLPLGKEPESDRSLFIINAIATISVVELGTGT